MRVAASPMLKGRDPMSEANSFRIDEAAVDQLLGVARLELSPERRTSMYPAYQMVVELMDSLDSLDMAEVMPATAFDPSWEI